MHLSTRSVWPLMPLLALLALSTCAPTVPVVVQPIDCPISVDVLASRCAAPQTIANGATYGEVLLAHQLDRKALRDCAAHDQLLAEVILSCQSTIRDYNQRLTEINRANAAKR